MAGIYIHIPFCKQACSYCDFHFSTNLGLIENMMDAICREILLRKDYFNTNNNYSNEIETIYFGGGTPSIVPVQLIEKVFKEIERNFKIASNPEITLEANPDDLSSFKLKELKATPINRFSIGVQSFAENDLNLMKRAHSNSQAEDAIKRTQDIGFENITIDLIYGTPTLSDENFKLNIKKALELQINHISAYALTLEEKTLLNHWVKNKQISAPEESKIENHFYILTEKLAEAGFEHYEISNFAKPGYRAVHNSNYWKGKPYLGIGPSAHSFNGVERSFNIRNNPLYIKQILENDYNPEIEKLSIENRYNEYVLIGLRTIEGVNSQYIEREFGWDYKNHFEKMIKTQVAFSNVSFSDDVYILTQKGKLFADKIASDCFRV